MEFISREIIVASTRNEIKIVCMGCIHTGAAGCDETLADFWYDRILKSPDTYVILGGDLVDAIHEKDKRYLSDEVARWCHERKWGGTLIDRQYHYALAKWRPLADAGKILWIHAGNHEWKLKTTASRDLTLDWARELGVPYAGLSALSNLKVRTRSVAGLSGRYMVRFYSQHGGGGAQSDGGIINRAAAMLSAHDVDVALMWHVHRKMHVTSRMLGVTQSDPPRRTLRDRVAASCGTFLDGHCDGVGSYAELKGYKPTATGPVVVHIKREVSKRSKSDPERATTHTRIWVSDAILGN